MVLLASFAITSAVNYAFGLAAGWLLAPGDFGLLAFAQTILLVAGLMLNAGFPLTLTAAIVGVVGERRAALVRGSLVGNVALALAIGAVLLALFRLGPLQPGLETPAIALVVALSLPFIAIAAITRHAAQSAEQYGFVAAIAALEIVGKAAAGIALIAAGFGAAGGVAGFLVGAVLAAALGLFYVGRRQRIDPFGSIRLLTMRTALPMFGGPLGLALLLNLDLLALKLFGGGDRAQVGFYQAALILTNAPYFLVTSALVPVLFTQMVAQRGAAGQAHLGETLRRVAVLLIPLELLLIVAPEAALRLVFPAAYSEAASTLRLLALGSGMMLVVPVLVAALQATGRPHLPAIVLLGIVAVEALVLRLAVPAFGATGAAAVFIAAAMSALLLLSMECLSGSAAMIPRGLLAWLVRYGLTVAISGALALLALAWGAGLLPAVALGGLSYVTLGLRLRLAALPRPTGE